MIDRIPIDVSNTIRMDEQGRVVRTPAIDVLLLEVRGLLDRDALYTVDRAKVATALELVDEEAKRLGLQR